MGRIASGDGGQKVEGSEENAERMSQVALNSYNASKVIDIKDATNTGRTSDKMHKMGQGDT